MEKVIITVKVKGCDLIKATSAIALSMRRKPCDTERLLAYLISESADGKYYAGHGKAFLAQKKLRLTPSVYRKAFKDLVQTGTIIQLPNDNRSKICYYKFCGTINRLLKL